MFERIPVREDVAAAPAHVLDPQLVASPLPADQQNQSEAIIASESAHGHEHKIGVPIYEDENERRWLVPKRILPLLLIDETVEVGKEERIVQGYMRDAEGRKFRLRQTTNMATHEVTYMVNQKVPKGNSRLSRGEPKAYVDEQIFRDFWPLASQTFIMKLRQHVKWRDNPTAAGLHIELDDVGDPDWVIAEVEFNSEEAARDEGLVFPEWFGEEVTEKKEWGNNSIAKHGTPKPSESPKPEDAKKKHKKK